MPKQSFVELESGEQQHFDNPYLAFKYAKEQEETNRNSVVLVGIAGELSDNDDELFFFMDQITVYRGQRLRHLIRSLDDVSAWVRTQVEQVNAEEASDTG